MTMLAVGLILLSAVLHATWNLFAKRAQGGAAFTWLYDLLALAIFAPVVIVSLLLSPISFSLWSVVWILGSGLLELGYFLLLQRGYRVGDLSLVYPLARGTGPLLTTIVAILVFQERPTLFSLLGTACMIGGVMLIAWNPQNLSESRARLAVLYGVLTGCCIAGYTLWDKAALNSGQLTPLILYYGTICVRIPLLTPFVLKHWSEVRFHWHTHRLEAFGIAVLSATSYILVLTALTFTPVSYVAPFREVSVLFGIIMGAQLLAEGEVKRRLLAAGFIVLGIVALAL